MLSGLRPSFATTSKKGGEFPLLQVFVKQPSTFTPDTRPVEGTVIIDLVEAKTNQLVWRAITTKTGDDLLDVQSEKKVDKMVANSFKHFPPEIATTH